jgi:LPXTG-site transpeptidase (sortase) family protein
MIHRFDSPHSPSHESTDHSDVSWFAHWAAPLLLFLVACFALGYYGYAMLDAHFFHSRQARNSDQALQPAQSSNGSAPNAATDENPPAASSAPRNGNTPNGNLPAEASASTSHRPPSDELRSEAAAELKGRVPDFAKNGGGKYSFGPFPKLLPSPPSRGTPAMPSFDKNGNSSSREIASASNAPLGRIEISVIGLKATIQEGAGYRTLQRGVGHITGTASLGHTGNVGLAGDRDTFFRNLRNIREGDLITLTTSNGAFPYRVELISITDGENSAVLRNNGENVLTLITGYPFNSFGNAPKRFIVRAKQLPSM